MTIQQGSLSLSRYKVLGFRKSLKLADMNKHFLPLRAKPLRLQGVHKPVLVGWVPPVGLGIDVSQTEWDLSDCRLDEGFLLRLRLERRQVPGPLLQLLVRQELEQVAARRSKPIKRPERQQIVNDLKTELMSKTLPS